MATENAKTGTDLQVVEHGIRDGSNTFLTWVPGDLKKLGSLTKMKTEAFKTTALYTALVARFRVCGKKVCHGSTCASRKPETMQQDYARLDLRVAEVLSSLLFAHRLGLGADTPA